MSGGTVTGTLVLSKNTDLSGTANNSPALIVGGAATAAHIEIDPNEIQAKTNGTSVADLSINNDGGTVFVNGVNVRSASIINSGAIGIAHGGTGHTATQNATSSVITAGSGITIRTQEVAYWGKVCQIHIKYTYNAAISSGNVTNITVGTLNDGYKPKIMSAGWSHGDEGGRAWHTITTGGVVSLGATDQSIAANTSIHCFATFILP